MSVSDVINHLAGISPGGRLDISRRQRIVARDNTQASYLALFAPDAEGDMTVRERYAVAAFVAGVHREAVVGPFYAEGLEERDHLLAHAVAAEVDRVGEAGPYGAYPDGKLTAENVAGPTYKVLRRDEFGPRIAAALEHAHLLVFHPRDSSAALLEKLLDAGWSTTGIVTLSQLVAFLAFQVRVVHGLRVMGAAGGQ